MLQNSPSARFQSADAVLTELTRIQQSPNRRPRRSTQNTPAATPAVTTLPATGSSPPATRAKAAIAPFSLPELLLEAGFTGFEGGLLAIALVSILGTTFISAGFWVVLLGVLILAQARRLIERTDLLILAGFTLTLVLFIPPLRAAVVPLIGNGLMTILVIASLMGLVAIAVTALFRLVYGVMRRWL